MNIPKCVDCKWCLPEPGGTRKETMFWCDSPHQDVIGHAAYGYHLESCLTQRKGWCGIEGRFFANSEEIDETTAPPLVTPKEQLLGAPVIPLEAIPEAQLVDPNDFLGYAEASTKVLRQALLGESAAPPPRELIEPEKRMDELAEKARARRELLGEDDTDSPIRRE